MTPAQKRAAKRKARKKANRAAWFKLVDDLFALDAKPVALPKRPARKL